MTLAEALKELSEDTRLVRSSWGGPDSAFHLAYSAAEAGLDLFCYMGEGSDRSEVQVMCYSITQMDVMAMDWQVLAQE